MMAAAYSIDLREKVVQQKLTGNYTNQEIADMFMIGITSVKEYVRKHNNNESLSPKKPSGRPPIVTEQDKELIKIYIKSRPDATLQDYRDQFEHDTKKSVTVQCIHLVIKGLNISFKKKVYTHRKGSVRMLKKKEKIS